MKVVMIMVSTVNGKITHGNDTKIYKWTSAEDHQFFLKQIKANNLIVMGSGTYDAVKPTLKIVSEKLRVVMTRNPKKYSKEQVPGQLEFTSESPEELLLRLSKKYKQMLLVGGGRINTLFLKAGLIDQIYLSIEPILFGYGKNIFEEGDFENKLKLLSAEKLNSNGTILLKYKVIE